MKAGKSSDTAMVLPRLSMKLAGGAEGLVLGGDAADQLDQLHHRHRVHEMHADEALGPVGDRGQARDRDRRGVGRQDGALLRACGQRSMKILRLTASSSVAASMTRSASPRRRQVGRVADALQRRLHLGIGDDAARDLARHVALDGGARLVDRLLLQVVEGDVVAGQRDDMGDAVAHLAGADDADRLDGRPARRLRALAGSLHLTAGLLGLDACVHDALLLQHPG